MMAAAAAISDAGGRATRPPLTATAVGSAAGWEEVAVSAVCTADAAEVAPAAASAVAGCVDVCAGVVAGLTVAIFGPLGPSFAVYSTLVHALNASARPTVEDRRSALLPRNLPEFRMLPPSLCLSFDTPASSEAGSVPSSLH
ncbi:hypothetical protein AGR4C_Cc120229 [Agrobacterium tumefaciens str. Kerr 14]|uniref:Uncharacterized protein n=1 Tax=Agrobacterium tumefaciens str. Kerr 14 TaxID=1183424 RepID=A0A1S7NTU7_AGRTU|nr:hypothetical protein AGR4C_Cc120229 [Agrobacterium tumefaciens str. Kerr 14]